MPYHQVISHTQRPKFNEDNVEHQRQLHSDYLVGFKLSCVVTKSNIFQTSSTRVQRSSPMSPHHPGRAGEVQLCGSLQYKSS